MAYRDNVTALATKLGISNNPGLREEDVLIAELRFTMRTGETVCIDGTDMNRGGRLFFQARVQFIGDENLIINEDLLGTAREYFAELWEPQPEPGKRKLLDALRSSTHVYLVWK